MGYETGKLLVVESDEALREHIVAVLSDAGYEVSTDYRDGMKAVLAFDPDGHAMQLYWSMEQIGWDGKPRPAASRRKIVAGKWPKTLEADADSYAGEPFLGPLG